MQNMGKCITGGGSLFQEIAFNYKLDSKLHYICFMFCGLSFKK